MAGTSSQTSIWKGSSVLQPGTMIRQIRILKALSGGAMGEVYLGLDESLQRKVALKAIRPDAYVDPSARRRFLREARILSRLDHPKICRIYEYIEDEDRDVLVLEHIQGLTLGRFLQKEELNEARRVEIARDIAQALAAAHRSGIVHRDLKPDNIMQGEDGSFKVVDFGIAYSQEEMMSDEIPTTAASHAFEEDEEKTQVAPRAIRGTVRYMSPEQIRGEETTPASDLYSFGVILQELFTGESAYATLSFYELIRCVEQAETRPINGVSPALKYLIRQLVSPSPQDRPTASEVDEELRKIQRAPRRRTRLAAVALTTLAFLGGAVKYTIDLRHEKQQAVVERNRAEALVDFMLDDLFVSLESVGRLDVLDQIAQRSLDHYESYPEEGSSAEVRSRHGLALQRVGRVRLDQGDLDGALEAFRRARAIHAELVEESPEHRETMLQWAESEILLGWVRQAQGDLVGALDLYWVAHEIYEDVLETATDSPERFDLLYGWSDVKSTISNVLNLQGRKEESDRLLRETGDILRTLVEHDSNRIDWTYGLAVFLNNQGDTFADVEDWESARDAYGEARKISRILVAREPNDAHWQLSLAQDEVSYGQALHSLGDLEEALAALTRAADLERELLSLDPTNVEWQYQFAMCQSATGDLHFDAGRLDEALEAYRAARAISRRLSEKDPSSSDWRASLAWDHFSVATALAEMRRGEEAEAELDESLRLLRRLFEEADPREDWQWLRKEVEALKKQLAGS